MNEKDDMYNQLSELFKANKLHFPDIIMNSQWRDTMERRRIFGMDFTAPDDEQPTIQGAKITYSSFVEPGSVYLVSQPRRFGKPNIEITPELHRKMQQSIEKIMHNAFLYGDKPQWGTKTEYNWHQFSDENLLQWGERLASKGLLDNHDIRWAYQWAILCFIVGYPLDKLKALRIKLAD